MYKKKFETLGIPAELVRLNSLNFPFLLLLIVKAKDEIFGSAYSAAIYISRVLCLPPEEKVYVIGEAGIEAELRSENISFLGGTDPTDCGSMTSADYDTFAPDPSVTIVLCGGDRSLTYKKLARAYQYLQNPNCRFLTTNTDSTFPSHGKIFPAAGICSEPLVYMLGGRRPLSLGKPSQAMMQAIEGKFKFNKSRACMVGDRLTTDIQFGIEGGLGGTLAVLTGVSKEEDYFADGAEFVPDVYVERLGDLLGHRTKYG